MTRQYRIISKTQHWLKNAVYKREYAVGFHLYEVSEVVKRIETEHKNLISKGWADMGREVSV